MPHRGQLRISTSDYHPACKRDYNTSTTCQRSHPPHTSATLLPHDLQPIRQTTGSQRGYQGHPPMYLRESRRRLRHTSILPRWTPKGVTTHGGASSLDLPLTTPPTFVSASFSFINPTLSHRPVALASLATTTRRGPNLH